MVCISRYIAGRIVHLKENILNKGFLEFVLLQGFNKNIVYKYDCMDKTHQRTYAV